MKKVKRLGILCCLVYFISYITRINYQATISEIITDFEITKQLASIAVTGSFITYGIGQVISGFIGDKLKPQNIITVGILGTALVNISVAFIQSIYVINTVWCLNGFFQALLWPPLVRIIAECLPAEKYENTVLYVSWSSYIATVIIYIIVPVIISFTSWRIVFLICAILAISFVIVWYLNTKNIKPIYDYSKVKQSAGKISVSLLLSVGIIPMLISILLQGMLRDGITTWMPTYIADTFDLGNNISILTTAILPLFSIFGTGVTTIISKKIKNELKSSALFFSVAFLSNIIMVLMFAKFIPLDIFCMAMVNVCMHGINLMLISNVPRHFARYGKVSTISGIMNAATYVGSALATYVFAALYDIFDSWKFNVLFWALLALLGAFLSAICIKKWKNFCKQEES